MRMTETTLFKVVSPYIKSITNKQLAKELVKAKLCTTHFSYKAGGLNEAFLWEEAPQGRPFWAALHYECVTNRNKMNINHQDNN